MLGQWVMPVQVGVRAAHALMDIVENFAVMAYINLIIESLLVVHQNGVIAVLLAAGGPKATVVGTPGAVILSRVVRLLPHPP